MELIKDHQQLYLLKGEFPNVKDECLVEIMEHFENDFETCRDCLTELFCDYFFEDSTTTSSSSDTVVYLPITTDLFDNLYSMFNSKHNKSTIREDLNIDHSIYLPAKLDLAYEIYWNLMQYVDGAYGQLPIANVSDEEEAIGSINDQNDNSDLLKHNDYKSTSLNEIMATQSAINISRQEYLNELIRRRKESLLVGKRDDALIQEWILEKKRDFLIKHFPGVDLFKLNRLFELNFFNLNETIKDIEAFYDCKLPSYYNKSLYSEMVKKAPPPAPPSPTCLSSKTRPSKTTSKSVSKAANQIANIDDVEEGHFKEKIGALVKQRNMLHIKMEHLKRKKIRFIMNGRHNVVHVYHNEINRCYHELRSISDDLIDVFQNYHYPNNQIDLHGLVLEEVRIIIPSILRFKHQHLEENKINFKIITGVGGGSSGSAIRKYVLGYLTKKKFIHDADGPGAFVLSLHAGNNRIDF